MFLTLTCCCEASLLHGEREQRLRMSEDVYARLYRESSNQPVIFGAVLCSHSGCLQ